MNLPDVIKISGYNIYTFGIFLLIGFLVAVFVVWQEGKKDGFDEERLFDLFVLSTFFSILFARTSFGFINYRSLGAVFFHVIKFWTSGLEVVGLFIGAVAPLYIFSRLWKWSGYRILDIFSLAWSLGFSIVMLGYVALKGNFKFLFAFAAWIIVYAIFVKIRNSKVKSGTVFSVFLVLNALLGAIFFGWRSYLIFYALLVILSIANYLARLRKDSMKRNLPENFLNLFKGKLKEKDKSLKNEEQLLSKEDPYRSGDRLALTPELGDEVREDMAKNTVDKRKSSIQTVRVQIRKALAKIKIGTYGICEVCGGPVETARLVAYPEATTCVSCANKPK